MSQQSAVPFVSMTADAHGLGVHLTHGPSGTSLDTQPPKDNGGTGAAFSPTDLVGAALASCAITTMALAARRENLPFGDARATVEKRMTPPPRRIASLTVNVAMPKGLSPELRKKFEDIALNCPVKLSLHPQVELPITFTYED